MRDFKKVFRRLAVTAVLAVFVMASAIPSLAATYQDGTYSVPVSLTKGRMSHNAIVSPCSVTISGGQIYATIVFKRVSDDGTPQYSYFTTTAGTVYPQQYGAHAQIFSNAPLSNLGSVDVTMETTAMSTPYTLNYTFYFDDSAIPTVSGSPSESSVSTSAGSSGDSPKASEKTDDKKDDKAKEDSKDDKNSKASDKSKKADKKAAKKADDKKQTSAKASESKNSKLPLYIGGLVVSLGVAGVGILMILKIGKKK